METHVRRESRSTSVRGGTPGRTYGTGECRESSHHSKRLGRTRVTQFDRVSVLGVVGGLRGGRDDLERSGRPERETHPWLSLSESQTFTDTTVTSVVASRGVVWGVTTRPVISTLRQTEVFRSTYSLDTLKIGQGEVVRDPIPLTHP